MLPYPATRFAKNISNLCGAKQQLAGVKFSSAGADANKGFLIMGLFTGHMLPSFQNLTAPIMLIARARTDKSNATCTDPAELESDLQEFEKTLNQASSKLPQSAVSSIKTGVIAPLRSKPHLSRNDAIALFGIWISVILWMLSQSLPNKQLALIHEDSVQIKEGLNQVIELDENLVNTAQVICDKLDALRTQGQDVINLCDFTSNTKQPDSLQKAPDAQK